ncbi:hypothetical protein J8N05_45670 [Streptomyces sp. BH-SS-21]|uniref:Uncharacterized protein n=1 Tax=Streptomyces liliiviolaceus TaxID=2823109 RepID=A0A941BBZ1_9ACTN|nr:hypothetical protein [Streptomyces liliiviolaceus]MBQ0855461.1 hypothetical protein [Streptomyces liliiviolaceus]
MSDYASDGDVVGVLTAQIEGHFGMSMDQLKKAVDAAPVGTPATAASEVVKWHGMVLDSQAAFERAEQDLFTVLQSVPSDDSSPSQDLIDRVAAAAASHEGRALVVRWLLKSDASGEHDVAAGQPARSRGTLREISAAPTTAPPAASAPQPGRSAVR